MKRFLHIPAPALFVLVLVTNSYAYIGPGVDVTMIGAFIALLASMGAALWALLTWPIRRFFRRKKENSARPPDDSSTGRPSDL
jgi:hypothetical protein